MLHQFPLLLLCVPSQILSRFPRREAKRHQLHVYRPMNSDFFSLCTETAVT